MINKQKERVQVIIGESKLNKTRWKNNIKLIFSLNVKKNYYSKVIVINICKKKLKQNK